MSFDYYGAMQKQVNKRKTLTENGAVAYATTGNPFTSFNFEVSAMRIMSPNGIKKRFQEMYLTDKINAVAYLFYLGDIRYGLGERRAFRICLSYMIDKYPEVAKAVLPLVPEYNRWDSVLVYIENNKTKNFAIDFIKKQLKADKKNRKNGEPISLCAKWMPSVNASSPKTKSYAKEICFGLGWTEEKYRKTLSKLRAYLDIVERKMSAGEWDKINYENVPSCANLKYNGAFLRNDEDRRRNFLNALEKGTAQINSGVLNPHDIVHKYINSQGFWGTSVGDYDPALEAMWKGLPQHELHNTLVVRDGSGSMLVPISNTGVTCLDVATALSIYMAEHNSGMWKDKFITFSSRPEVVDLSSQTTLRDRIAYTMGHNDCSNTDIYKTMMLILKVAVDNNLEQSEMPEMITICSDMQFDGRYFGLDETLFESIAKKYKRNGYKMPRICFWNIAGNANGTIPMQENELGLILCSGFSVNIMDMFLSNELDPYKILLETLNSERYDPVREAVKGIL